MSPSRRHTRSAAAWLAPLAALAVGGALLGCADRPATQIIVRVDSDMAEGTELQRVDVTAFFESSPEQPVIRDARFDLADGGYGLPGELSLVPRNPEEPRRLFVTVTGHTPAGPVTQRSRVFFEAGRKLVMVMYLARSCRVPTCGAGATCGNDGRCRPEDRPALETYTPPDASAARTDGAVDGVAQNPFPSTGAEGPFPPADAGALVTLASGIHHFTTLHVPRDMRVVTDGGGVLDLRATGPVLIEGTIDLGGGRGGYEGSGAGAQGGCAACGAMTIPTVRTRVMGVGGAGVEGGAGSDGTLGGRFGGGTGAYVGSGGGGGGYAGGGGGYGNGAVGGAGASFVGMSGVEAGGAGGGASRVQGGGGGGDLEMPLDVYRGGDGSPSPAGCPSVAGGGGGGSIGRGAARDLGLRTHFRGGSGGGGGGGGPRARGGGGAGGGGGGGGALRIASPVSIEVARGAALLASGGDGGGGDQSDPTAVVGGGGGGSGGVIDLASPRITIVGSLSAAGGAGGPPSTPMCRGAGGAGGLGRIRLTVDPSRCQVDGGLTPPMPAGECVPSPAQGRPGEVYISRWPD